MAKVALSKNLSQARCRQTAATLASAWQEGLTRLGSDGRFEIGHGGGAACGAVHGGPYNGGFWIWTDPPHCLVFQTLKGNLRDFAGASRVDLRRYRGPGHCSCVDKH